MGWATQSSIVRCIRCITLRSNVSKLFPWLSSPPPTIASSMHGSEYEPVRPYYAFLFPCEKPNQMGLQGVYRVGFVFLLQYFAFVKRANSDSRHYYFQLIFLQKCFGFYCFSC